MPNKKQRAIPYKFGLTGQSKIERRNATTGLWSTSSDSRTSSSTAYSGFQLTESESHSWPPKSGGRSDVGGPFYTIKREIDKPSTIFGHSTENALPPGINDRIRGRWSVGLGCPIPSSNYFPSHTRTSDSVLNVAGATAISRCKPTSSGVELGTAIGEIRKDGLPHLIGSSTWEARTKRAKGAASDYLNVVFGWKPLIADITDFGKTVKKSDHVMQQYDADRGNTVRRQYEFPPDIGGTTDVILSSAMPPDSGGMTTSNAFTAPFQSTGVWRRRITTSTRRWFKGAFVYGVPNGIYSGSESAEFAARADRLVGVSLTPDLLWNLSPWSWAVDWFTNTGDVLSNVSDYVSQGLVMQYGYIMETKVTKATYSLEGPVYYGKAVSVPPATLTITSKARVRANPFGFGITWDGLSLSQAAILSALGISRS